MCQDSLRRRLGNSLQWYQVLASTATAAIAGHVQANRQAQTQPAGTSTLYHTPLQSSPRLLSRTGTGSFKRQRGSAVEEALADGASRSVKRHRRNSGATPPSAAGTLASLITPRREPRTPLRSAFAGSAGRPRSTRSIHFQSTSNTTATRTADAPLPIPVDSTLPSPVSPGDGKKASDTPISEPSRHTDEHPPESQSNPNSTEQTQGRERPSDHLRACCPLCFGGAKPQLKLSP
jgi:hypothetical protein